MSEKRARNLADGDVFREFGMLGENDWLTVREVVDIGHDAVVVEVIDPRGAHGDVLLDADTVVLVR